MHTDTSYHTLDDLLEKIEAQRRRVDTLKPTPPLCANGDGRRADVWNDGEPPLCSKCAWEAMSR